MNLFGFALKMELDGKSYYEKLEEETSIAGLKTIFAKLAADEQKHYDAIVAIKENTGGAMDETTVLEEARNIFDGLRSDDTAAGSMKKAVDGYRHAMKIEADSVRLYEDMAKEEKNPEIVMIALRIANEEKKHLNIMSNLYEFGLKPEYFLEWVEFSNRERL